MKGQAHLVQERTWGGTTEPSTAAPRDTDLLGCAYDMGHLYPSMGKLSSLNIEKTHGGQY